MLVRLFSLILAVLLALPLAGCRDGLLDPDAPVRLSFWHVYGAQSDSPMNRLVERFNLTEGKKRGIIVNVTSLSNTVAIHFPLVAAAKGEPGTGVLPDIFVTYPKTVLTIGADHFADWNDHVPADVRKDLVPAFLEEGMVDGRQVMFPVAKSSRALFVNATIFDRFAAETGLLTCREGDSLAPATGLNSGAYADNFTESFSDSLKTAWGGRLNRYVSAQGSFVGMERKISLSPLDGDNHWVTALLVPESAHRLSVHLRFVKMAVFSAVFLVLSYFFCYRISRRFIDPVLAKIDAITAGKAERTEIPEIDDLIDYLSREDPSQRAQDDQPDMTGCHTFLANIETLSKAEKAVFDLYVEGFSAPEIAERLHVTIHTVKSHNRRIYAKLNISSRKELLLFIHMMKPGHRD